MSENTEIMAVSTPNKTKENKDRKIDSKKNQNKSKSELRGQPKSGRFWKTKKEK